MEQLEIVKFRKFDFEIESREQTILTKFDGLSTCKKNMFLISAIM